MLRELYDFIDRGTGVMVILIVTLTFFSGMLVGILWDSDRAKNYMYEKHKCPYELKTNREVVRRF